MAYNGFSPWSFGPSAYPQAAQAGGGPPKSGAGVVGKEVGDFFSWLGRGGPLAGEEEQPINILKEQSYSPAA